MGNLWRFVGLSAVCCLLRAACSPNVLPTTPTPSVPEAAGACRSGEHRGHDAAVSQVPVLLQVRSNLHRSATETPKLMHVSPRLSHTSQAEEVLEMRAQVLQHISTASSGEHRASTRRQQIAGAEEVLEMRAPAVAHISTASSGEGHVSTHPSQASRAEEELEMRAPLVAHISTASSKQGNVSARLPQGRRAEENLEMRSHMMTHDGLSPTLIPPELSREAMFRSLSKVAFWCANHPTLSRIMLLVTALLLARGLLLLAWRASNAVRGRHAFPPQAKDTWSTSTVEWRYPMGHVRDACEAAGRANGRVCRYPADGRKAQSIPFRGNGHIDRTGEGLYIPGFNPFSG